MKERKGPQQWTACAGWAVCSVPPLCSQHLSEVGFASPLLQMSKRKTQRPLHAESLPASGGNRGLDGALCLVTQQLCPEGSYWAH